MNNVLCNACYRGISLRRNIVLVNRNDQIYMRIFPRYHFSSLSIACRMKQGFTMHGMGRFSNTAFMRNSFKNISNVKLVRVNANRFISIFSKPNKMKFQNIDLGHRATSTNALELKHKTVLIYLTSVAIFTVGLSYAAVPLYRLYCQASGYGGTTKKSHDDDDIEDMQRLEDRPLTVRFEGSTSKKLQWKFKPQQKEVKLAPGETALAFYTAKNLTNRPIIGIATYNVIPFDAGQYFNKIQCFCFEEQQLNPNEEVDMPVFFYIDPEFDEDPKMAKVEEIILSYVFFESNDSNEVPSVMHGVKL